MIYASGYYNPKDDTMAITIENQPRPKATEIWSDIEAAEEAAAQKRLDEAKTIVIMQCEMTQCGCDKGFSIWANELPEQELRHDLCACDFTVLIDGDEYRPD